MSNSRGGGSFRSAISGRYITAKHGNASPRTTVRENSGSSGSSGSHYRSAISGRYVTTAHGKASPHTTVKGVLMMAKRYVRATGKNSQGDITKLCNSGEFWSPRSKADAISDIDGGTHEYWVNWANAPETKIRVVQGATGKYLRTDRDTTSRNNLDDLPDC